MSVAKTQPRGPGRGRMERIKGPLMTFRLRAVFFRRFQKGCFELSVDRPAGEPLGSICLSFQGFAGHANITLRLRSSSAANSGRLPYRHVSFRFLTQGMATIRYAWQRCGPPVPTR